MNTFRTGMCGLALVALVSLSGCADGAAKSADVSASIRTSLDQAGLKSVTVGQDRDKGIVTLTGNVPAEADKDRAASIAKGLAGMQVVANEVAVLAPGVESETKKANAALDKGIESNLEAALIKEKLQDGVSYASNNHVVTMAGNVDSQEKRARIEKIATAIPNVQQVVNELQVIGQKASSSK
jgi:hyperosmotically inducible periplasmic protein